MKMNYSLNYIGRTAKTWCALFAIVTLSGANQLASAASTSELLEKGIYSEETKGDLDAALELYQQAIAEAKGGQAVAAQAQYRLAVCLYKKKNFAEANAAFEKLIKDYPDQKDLIARANEYLAGASALMPAPWTDGEELVLDVKLGGGLKIGTARYTVSAGELNGRKIWRVGSRMNAGMQSFSRVEVEAATFKPIHSRWKHMLLGDADAVYGPDQVEVKTVGKDGSKKFDLKGMTLDNEEVVQWMRRLPLANGYQTSARVVTSLGGAVLPGLKLDVSGPEKVEVPAGTFNCYKVELSVSQTFWYSADEHRYVVKFEAGGAMAELTAINQQKANSPVVFSDPAANFSLTAPAGWHFDRDEPDVEKGGYSVTILDPDAQGLNDLLVKNLAHMKPEAKKSLRAFAENEVEEAAKVFKDFKVRPDSWKETTVAGRPAISFAADYVFGKDKNVGYGVFTMGSSNGFAFRTMTSAKDFDDLKPKFDSVVDSFTVK